MIDEQELRRLLQSKGWYLWMHQKYNVRYAYAKRRIGSKIRSRYISANTKFDSLTPDKVLKKISS
jgi:hypothetical protein